MIVAKAVGEHGKVIELQVVPAFRVAEESALQMQKEAAEMKALSAMTELILQSVMEASVDSAVQTQLAAEDGAGSRRDRSGDGAEAHHGCCRRQCTSDAEGGSHEYFAGAKRL